MPSEDTVVELRPKWPPKNDTATDKFLEEEFEKLSIRKGEDEPKIPLQSRVNQSAKALRNLLEPTDDRSPTERGVDDVDGYLDQVPSGASRGWATDGVRGHRPPPAYRRYHVTKPPRHTPNLYSEPSAHCPVSNPLPQDQTAYLQSQGTPFNCAGNLAFGSGQVNQGSIPAYYNECHPQDLNEEEALELVLALSESEQSNTETHFGFDGTSVTGDICPPEILPCVQSTVAPLLNQMPFFGSQAFSGTNQCTQQQMFYPLNPAIRPDSRFAQVFPPREQIQNGFGVISPHEQIQKGFGGVPLTCNSNPILPNGKKGGYHDISQTHSNNNPFVVSMTHELEVDGAPPSSPFSLALKQVSPAAQPSPSSNGKRSHIEEANSQEPQHKSPKSYSGSTSNGNLWTEGMDVPKIIPTQVELPIIETSEDLEKIYRQIEASHGCLKDSISANLQQNTDLVEMFTKGDNSRLIINDDSHQSTGSPTQTKDTFVPKGDNSQLLNEDHKENIPTIVPNSPMVASPAVVGENYLDSPPCSPFTDPSETIAHHLTLVEPKRMTDFCREHGDDVRENINSRNRFLQTPLYMATKRQNYAAVEMCLDFGADPSIQGKDDKSEVMEAPLHVAIGNEDPKMVNMLLQFPGIDIEQQRVYDRKTPLMLALHGHNGTTDDEGELRRVVIRMLVEANANLHKLDEQSDKTVFMMTIETGDLVLIKYILEYVTVQGSRELINQANRAGNTSFHIAAGLKKLEEEDQLELLKVLVYYGGNTDAMNLDNKTPKDWKKSLFDKMKKSTPYQPEDDD